MSKLHQLKRLHQLLNQYNLQVFVDLYKNRQHKGPSLLNKKGEGLIKYSILF